VSETKRRLSVWRIFVLVAVVALLGTAGWVLGGRAYEQATEGDPVTWYAPYVDVTLTPTLHFEDPLVSPAKDHALGFVVADREAACAPTWGTYYDLDGAGRQLDLDRRIVRLRERGGDVVVSFGGAVNDELAVRCTDAEKLLGAYRLVVDRYDLTRVDFDIEGTAIADAAANARRATAVAQLQAEARRDGRDLEVWLTLPVAPFGLPDDVLQVVTTTLEGGVDLAGVNVMTMNYGGSREAGQSMGDAHEAALTNTHRQLMEAYAAAGVPLTAAQVWARMGATPMIGVNDVEGEEFTLDDARRLVGLANRVRLGRMSMWSANRDKACGAQQGEEGRVSNTCSGVSQEPLAFSWELGRLNGDPAVRTPAPAPAERADAAVPRDDPSASPYPIWRESRGYELGDKVVWHQGVYQAKWYTRGDLPDAKVEHLWDTPWRYIGPVLETDGDERPEAARVGGRAWSADAVYLRGDRVSHGGFIYRAKWWTQSDEPEPAPENPEDSPWTLLGRAPAVKGPVARTAYPPWTKSRTYLPGSRVTSAGRAYEATAWTQGARPRPASSAPKRHPWREIAKLSAPAAPGGG